MKNIFCRRAAAAVILCMLMFGITGCNTEKKEPVRVKDLDFTVVLEKDVPEALTSQINEKKKEPFLLVFRDDKNTYISRGYGEQKSGGYSIIVNEVYMSEEGVYFNSELVGPSQQELVAQICTYPYIVIKTELFDGSVLVE